jgi:hypothetical protein
MVAEAGTGLEGKPNQGVRFWGLNQDVVRPWVNSPHGLPNDLHSTSGDWWESSSLCVRARVTCGLWVA